MPSFTKDKDYEFLYYELLHDNEKKLQKYDSIIKEREEQLKLYKNML